jgi:hypothetical protein
MSYVYKVALPHVRNSIAVRHMRAGAEGILLSLTSLLQVHLFELKIEYQLI